MLRSRAAGPSGCKENVHKTVGNSELNRSVCRARPENAVWVVMWQLGSCRGDQGRILVRVTLIKSEEAACDGEEDEEPFGKRRPWPDSGSRRFRADLGRLTAARTLPSRRVQIIFF